MQTRTWRTWILAVPLTAALATCGGDDGGGGDGDGGPDDGGPDGGNDGGDGMTGADDGSDGATGDGGADDGGDGGPDAPEIVMLSLSAPSMTEGETVTVTALVTDPQGTDDILGGSLTTEDGVSTYGPFQGSGTPGNFSLDLTWQQLHMAMAIDFTGSDTRTLRAEFVDMAGHSSSKTVDLGLTCAGDVAGACAGSCRDLSADNENCGECGRVCVAPTQPPLSNAACVGGVCPPKWGECVEGGSTCADACQAQGESCVEGGCDGITFIEYANASFCEDLSGSGGSGSIACTTPLSGSGATRFRCCCTDSG